MNDMNSQEHLHYLWLSILIYHVSIISLNMYCWWSKKRNILIMLKDFKTFRIKKCCGSSRTRQRSRIFKWWEMKDKMKRKDEAIKRTLVSERKFNMGKTLALVNSILVWRLLKLCHWRLLQAAWLVTTITWTSNLKKLLQLFSGIWLCGCT